MQTLEERVAAGIRQARLRLGLTQSELASLAQSVGAKWTQSKVAAMETGRRDIGLGEALVLGNLLGVGLVDLVLAPAENNDVLVGGVRVTSEQLGRMMRGLPILTGDEAAATLHVEVFTAALRRRIKAAAESHGLTPDATMVTTIEAASHGAAERSLARNLRLGAEEVAAASIARWGRSLSAEIRSRRRRGMQRTDVEHLKHELGLT